MSTLLPKMAPGQRVAVVGAGISGLATAWLLSRQHDVTLFEAAPRLGGHTNTVEVELEGVSHPVDTGFLVFNDRTYPNLLGLFAALGVRDHASEMSFGVSLDEGRLEWAGSNLRTVFAQPGNLLSPRFLGMLRDILRFNRAADAHLAEASMTGCSLGQLLDAGRYGGAFREQYLLPMAAAIWSSAPADILEFPAATFLRFCQNHGLLQITDRPQWRTVVGGGREYVRRIALWLRDVRLSTPVLGVRRDAGGVTVLTAQGSERFDALVLATHAPTTLKLLSDADADETRLLRALRVQPNRAVLHTDTALLPRRKAVWSAWNYLGGTAVDGQRPVCVSYLINRLQPVPFHTPVIVTLNPVRAPRPETVLGEFDYAHPLFDLKGGVALERLSALQGVRRTWFAGAWTGYGFHEDGLKSALRVAANFVALPEWARL